MLDVAIQIFERLTGLPLTVRQYVETKPYISGGIKLENNPVLSLIDVKARHKSWEYGHVFGPTDWLDVTSLALIYKKRGITIPHGMYGDFDEVRVTYTAGMETWPDDVKRSIDEIAELLDRREITEWNVILPDHILLVVHKYRKGANQ